MNKIIKLNFEISKEKDDEKTTVKKIQVKALSTTTVLAISVATSKPADMGRFHHDFIKK